MPAEPLFTLTTDLRALGGGRVWSLMISLFGDLAQGEGDVIAGPVLSAIMAELGVRPEAARVALHRLRNDGWITSQKNGRISHHGLSAEGRAKSRVASPRIYDVADARGLRLILLDPQTDSSSLSASYIEVQPRVLIGSADHPAPDGAAVFDAQHAPDWLTARIILPELVTAYTRLADVLEVLQKNLPEAATLSPLQIASLRCLVVHNWRRLVLRHPAPPAELVSTDSAYGRCQIAVTTLLSRYKRPALDAIG